jgi:hypothetical protein
MKLPKIFVNALHRRAMAIMGKRDPDFIIGSEASPYLRRWWVIPRNRFFNVYLHVFLRDDGDRVLHDHPWASCSIILDGGYTEELPGQVKVWRAPGTVVVRRATAAHRVELARDRRYLCGSSDLHSFSLPATSIFLTGPTIRAWGFHCPKGWVHWRDFVKAGNPGEVGRSCGES